VKRAPAHAGGLRTPERLAFVLVFSLMAAFVVGLTVLAAKSGASPLVGHTTPAGSKTLPVGAQQPKGGTGQSGADDQTEPGGTGGAVAIRSASATLSARLATLLRTAVPGDLGQLSVGVIDMTTGATATYRPNRHYVTASIVSTDVLAALLYRDQQAREPVTATDAGLAAEMIQDGSDSAAARLWQAIGGSQGMAAANKALMLRHTLAARAGSRELTRTTVADQLQLLMDLTAANSALHSGARDYALGLLADGFAAAQWGVAAAASPPTAYAVTDGLRPDPRFWLADSIGVIQRHGHLLLIAVLSEGSTTEADAAAAVRAAAMAAATVTTTAAP
jgi:hypothetical protein